MKTKTLKTLALVASAVLAALSWQAVPLAAVVAWWWAQEAK